MKVVMMVDMRSHERCGHKGICTTCNDKSKYFTRHRAPKPVNENVSDSLSYLQNYESNQFFKKILRTRPKPYATIAIQFPGSYLYNS